jgi:hypothetical protein
LNEIGAPPSLSEFDGELGGHDAERFTTYIRRHSLTCTGGARQMARVD